MRLATAILSMALAGTAAAEEMAFDTHSNGGNCARCGWISAQGVIDEDAPDRLAAFLDENGAGQVVFHSTGGNLGAAVRMGRMLRERGISTGVGRTVEPGDSPWSDLKEGRCNSACVFAFMGGVTRNVLDRPGLIAARRGTLGVHRFYERQGQALPSGAAQQIMGQLLFYVLDMGLDPEILAIASRTARDGMRHLTEDEIRRLGLHTLGRHNSAPALEAHDGALALGWREIGEAGSALHRARLYCDLQEKRWLLDLRQLGAGGHPDDFFLDPARPEAMGLTLGETHFDMGADAILALEDDGEDHRILVRLPVDLRLHPGKDFDFRTNGLRNFRGALAAHGTVPGRSTLDLMARACRRG